MGQRICSSSRYAIRTAPCANLVFRVDVGPPLLRPQSSGRVMGRDLISMCRPRAPRAARVASDLQQWVAAWNSRTCPPPPDHRVEVVRVDDPVGRAAPRGVGHVTAVDRATAAGQAIAPRQATPANRPSTNELLDALARVSPVTDTADPSIVSTSPMRASRRRSSRHLRRMARHARRQHGAASSLPDLRLTRSRHPPERLKGPSSPSARRS